MSSTFTLPSLQSFMPPTVSNMADTPIKKFVTKEEASPLSFVFHGNEMIIQCTASSDDQEGAMELLAAAHENYRNFNDGKHAALVRCNGLTQYWISSTAYAETLNKDHFTILTKTTDNAAAKPPVPVKAAEHHKVTKVHIRRPRNQFIIYRQWMSGRIHAENPGVTAACISQVVSQMWRAEKPEVKVHFKALADEEDRMHKMKYPGYRFDAGRRNPQPALRKRNLTHDPMLVAERLVAAGF